jgi:hypothetical protein
VSFRRACVGHALRRAGAVEAARGSFDATVEAIERNTGTKVPKRQVEELVERAAQDFDAFREAAANVVPSAVRSPSLRRSSGTNRSPIIP